MPSTSRSRGPKRKKKITKALPLFETAEHAVQGRTILSWRQAILTLLLPYNLHALC